ncbi:hypothetical protein ABAC460_04715 [Asticcacaulis sp. AC460]|uniref:tetratricopeptide repeat protein n=1 Tax=Asticcacaulis sp. AC460 TaxID=1282360 RepID=UPI0003C3B764|nr:hypothetical protein [Asticcacaulis sp. AC460]ESQ92195.1 hypothetical protein ABAC460_04715 [Asticcacaulis sp. AC460]
MTGGKIILTMFVAAILAAPVVQAKTVHTSAAAPRNDVNQRERQVVQQLQGQKAADLVRERQLATAAQNQLLDENETLIRKNWALSKQNKQAGVALQAALDERDRLTAQILQKDASAQQELAVYERALRGAALSDDPQIAEKLEMLAAREPTLDEIESNEDYIETTAMLARRIQDIQQAAQLRTLVAEPLRRKLENGQVPVGRVIAAFEKAQALDSSDIWSGISLVRLYFYGGEDAKAYDLAQSLLPQVKDDRERMGLYNEMGRALEMSDPAGALDYYRKSLALTEARAQDLPDDLKAQLALSVSYERVADMTRNDDKAALALYQKSQAIREDLVRREPDNAAARRNLSVSYTNIGDLLRTSDPAGALDAYRKSLALKEEVVQRLPGNVQAQSDLSNQYERIANLVKANDPTTARDYLHKAIAISEPLAQSVPDNFEVQRGLTVIYDDLADLEKPDNRPAALGLYRKSLAIRETVAKRLPDNPQAQHDLLAGYWNIAENEPSRDAWARTLAQADRMKTGGHWRTSDDPYYVMMQDAVNGFDTPSGTQP